MKENRTASVRTTRYTQGTVGGGGAAFVGLFVIGVVLN